MSPSTKFGNGIDFVLYSIIIWAGEMRSVSKLGFEEFSKTPILETTGEYAGTGAEGLPLEEELGEVINFDGEWSEEGRSEQWSPIKTRF